MRLLAQRPLRWLRGAFSVAARSRRPRPARPTGVADAVARLRLDERIATGAPLGIAAPDGAVTLTRTPMPPGKSSLLLNRVEVALADGGRVRVVEKGIPSTGTEAAFWRWARGEDARLHGAGYAALRPLDLVSDDRFCVLYLPYVSGLARPTKELRVAFRRDLESIATAVAGLNADNTDSALPGGLRSTSHRWPFEPGARPSEQQLQQWLVRGPTAARALLSEWDEVRAACPPVLAAYWRLPRCLCHNDVSPSNTTHQAGVTTFTDFGLACPGPMGADLHTVFRWSDTIMADPCQADGVIEAYVRALAARGQPTTAFDVRLAAWTTFYLRYTNLRFRSARYPRVLTVALSKMRELIDLVGQLPHPPTTRPPENRYA